MRCDVKNVRVLVNGTAVVSDVSLALEGGTTHVLMGPNGSGKSSLLNALAGNPRYVIEGSVSLDGTDATHLPPEERARLGLFLAFQNPVEVPGVSLPSLLRSAANAIAESRGEKSVSPAPFVASLREHAHALGLPAAFLQRGTNEGFSGGEKKKAEILQMLALKPRVILLDEIDSGLDVDAIQTIVQTVKSYQKESGAAVLWVTHNPRVLSLIGADSISIMAKGKIVEQGGAELAFKVEAEGFSRYE